MKVRLLEKYIGDLQLEKQRGIIKHIRCREALQCD